MVQRFAHQRLRRRRIGARLQVHADRGNRFVVPQATVDGAVHHHAALIVAVLAIDSCDFERSRAVCRVQLEAIAHLELQMPRERLGHHHGAVLEFLPRRCRRVARRELKSFAARGNHAQRIHADRAAYGVDDDATTLGVLGDLREREDVAQDVGLDATFRVGRSRGRGAVM